MEGVSPVSILAISVVDHTENNPETVIKMSVTNIKQRKQKPLAIIVV